MSKEISGYYILGFTVKGKQFRPSDWVERIASVYGTFESKRHLKYHPMIKPGRYENQRCLFVDSRLSEAEPDIYKHIMGFAEANSLKIEAIRKPGEDKPASVHYQQVA